MFMAKRNSEVDGYIVALTPDRKQALSILRDLVFEVVPDAEESFTYCMPTYAHQGNIFCAYASQKQYISFYFMDTGLVADNKRAFKGLDLGKSCIRFRKINKLPMDTVKQMLEESVQGEKDH
jgi:uncharacterized protein YdhG (YjbR/CyaY superfamily)